MHAEMQEVDRDTPQVEPFPIPFLFEACAWTIQFDLEVDI
jgi:hypothetical protein